MNERAVEIGNVDWQRAFPWVRLFRVFRTAIDLRMLFLASLALIVFAVGESLLLQLPFAPKRPIADVSYRWDEPVHSPRPADFPGDFLRDPRQKLWESVSDWGVVLRPARTIVRPVGALLQAGATWTEKAFAWTRLLWALCVWAVFGGAMTRIAAVEQAREAKVSLLSSLRFSLQNFLSYMTATLLPAAGIGVFWLLCVIGGWIGRIPYVGGPFLGLLWGLELVFGFMMALILIGAAVGWPLMYATISTEGSDGFDGFSRAYSYVFSRPWHIAWYGIVAMAYGAVVTTFVSFVASLVAYLAGWGVASGLGLSATGGLLLAAPDSVGGAGLLTGPPAGELSVATLFVGAWLQIVALLISGFVTSYFWSAATTIYFLLRFVDDATDFQEVYLPDEQETDDLLPLVGVAASDQPVVERSPDGDSSAASQPPAVHAHNRPPNPPGGDAASGSIDS